MVFGRTGTELLQLNEDSVWYGGPQTRTPRDAYRHLQRLRECIRRGRHQEAEELVRLAFFAHPSSQRHYEPLGSLTLDFGHAEEKVLAYHRELDLSNATTTVEYEYEGARYRRQVIASYPDQVIAVRVECSRPTTYVVRLTRVSEREYQTNEFLAEIIVRDGTIILHATCRAKDPASTALSDATTALENPNLWETHMVNYKSLY